MVNILSFIMIINLRVDVMGTGISAGRPYAAYRSPYILYSHLSLSTAFSIFTLFTNPWIYFYAQNPRVNISIYLLFKNNLLFVNVF